jgi:hypothetical protein
MADPTIFDVPTPDEVNLAILEEMLEDAEVFLKEVDHGTPNACWVVCAKCDPGAVRFVPELTGFQRIG